LVHLVPLIFSARQHSTICLVRCVLWPVRLSVRSSEVRIIQIVAHLMGYGENVQISVWGAHNHTRVGDNGDFQLLYAKCISQTVNNTGMGVGTPPADPAAAGPII